MILPVTYRHGRRSRLDRLAAAAVFLATALAVGHAAPALAQWNFTLVADQATTGINIGTEAPSISGQEIAFFGNNNSRLYKVDPTGVPVTLFQTGGPIPGAGGLNFFQVFEPYSFSGQNFVFRGSTTTPTQNGAYALTNTGLVALAGLGSALPSSDGGFLAMDGNDVAFGGTTAIRVLSGGVVNVIADNTKQVPGTATNFSSFTAMDFHSGTVVFSGGGGARVGVYYDRNDGNGIKKLVDNTDTAPGGAALFSAFPSNGGRLAIHGNDVVFYGAVADGRIGIFLCRNFGPPQLIADYDPANPTFLPGGMERADLVQGISLSKGDVAFLARSQNNSTAAIFATQGGAIERVIGTGASLGGRTVDVPYGLNEMRSGNTIAFGVLFVENPLERAIYRADRGQPAVGNSGMIVNGSFANGLSNWTPSGSVNVVPGPAVQMTADGSIPGAAQLIQSVNTPNGSYMIFFDYRFTTTAGSLDLEINGTNIAHIPAPATVLATFTHAEILVNNTSLMGQNNANFTVKLNPGSLSDIFLRGIFSPLFEILSNIGSADLLVFVDLDRDGSKNPSTYGTDEDLEGVGVQATTSVAKSNATESASVTAKALISPFGGVQWAMSAAAQASQRTAGSHAGVAAIATYTVSGQSSLPPVVNFQLRLTGVFDLTGDFSQQIGTVASIKFHVVIKTPRAEDSVTKQLEISLTPGTRLASEVLVSQDLAAILNDPSGTSTITFAPTPPTGPPDSSRRYTVSILHDFPSAVYALVNEPVSLEIPDPSALDVTVAPAFNGTVSADFSQSFAGTLSTDTPGIQLVPAGLPLDCSTASLQELINVAPPGSTIPVLGTCNENLLVRNEKQRIAIDGSGAGAGTRATIVGSGTAPVVNIRGKGILLQNFNIIGGSHGVRVNRGSNAVINNNVIENTNGNGVVVDELAFAVLTNNTIQNNPDAGVFVSENSTARIGINSDADEAASFNTIQSNAVGVVVSNNSSARVIGNTIQNNAEAGVQILRDSHADIASNTINGNADGIEVGENSLVQLGEDSGSSIYESANSGTNTGFGIKCIASGVADGRIGSLSGGSGAKSFSDADCTDSLSP